MPYLRATRWPLEGGTAGYQGGEVDETRWREGGGQGGPTDRGGEHSEERTIT